MAFVKGIAPKQLYDTMGLYANSLWMKEMDRCWMDHERGYQVCSRLIRTKFGKVEHVSISKILPEGQLFSSEGNNSISWNEKMMIKNELFGKDRFAIEVYPKQDKLIDVCDVYHLWVFDKKYNMPFGIHPKEHIHAINRGYNMNLAELELLKADYELGDANAKLDGDTINTYSINDK